MRMTRIDFPAVLLGVALMPALSAQAPSLTGHWEGVIVLVPAEREVDVTADFKPAGGKILGLVSFPLTADGDHQVEDLHMQAPHVSFSVHDTEGIESTFDAALSADGTTLHGIMRERSAAMPFTMRRIKAGEHHREIQLAHLGESGVELVRAFNAEAGKVRIILLLDPRSFASRITLRIVERYVLDQISDPGLSVYAVWMTSDRPSAAKGVQYLAGLAADPRVTHFWSTNPATAGIFAPVLTLYKSMSRPCMLFASDRSWERFPPLPDGVRKTPDNAKEQLDPTQRLNGNDLAADVKRLLAKRLGGPANRTASSSQR